MGIVRMGEPDKYPETDTMIRRGIKYNLDMVVLHYWEADKRQKQLESASKIVYILPRYAPPEEVQNHLPNRGIPELGEAEVHLDGRYKQVYDVWVVSGREYRKKSNKSKPKVDASQDFLNGVLNVTKAAIIGGVGIGIVGSMGGMLHRKKQIKNPKVKKCRCKK